jgi:glucokinase
MMVTLGTGIGVALLVGGRPVGVIGGTLGDAGHVVVDPAGARSCRLGCRGCLESVASGIALIEMAEELADATPESALGALRRKAGITGAELAQLAAAGDPPTLDLLAQTGQWLGMGLASYSNTFAPDVICIGGGMSRFRPYLETALLEGSEAGRIKNRPGPETIYFSAEYQQAAARGAVTLFLSTGERGDG